MRDAGIRAAAANATSYASLSREKYICGAPHIRHPYLRQLYDGLTSKAFEVALKYSPLPRILDLGAGEGSVTSAYMTRGARVTVVDVTEARLLQLQQRCAGLPGELEIVCAEVFEAIAMLTQQGREYDLVVATAFLHHVPSYEDLLRKVLILLAQRGQLLTFEDPLRYDSLAWTARLFGAMAHLSWRLWQGDLAGGAHRFLRRKFGHYTDTPEDEVEYHTVRNGVDQEAIQRLLDGLGMECQIVHYFSTQAPLWEAIGRRLRIENAFGLLARRRALSRESPTSSPQVSTEKMENDGFGRFFQ